MRKVFRAVAVGLATALSVAACGGGSGGGTTSGGADTIKVGLLLPEKATIRWEKLDKPAFEAALKQTCPQCELLYGNAGNDQAKQQSQADAMMTQGAKLIVLTPVDSTAARTIVINAKTRGIKVLGYQRVPSGGPDGTVGDDLSAIGQANGGALVDAIKKSGRTGGQIVWLNGDKASGPSTQQIRDAARKATDPAGLQVGREYWTKDWDAATAQNEMDQAITALGKDQVAGVFSMNDGMAGGAIAAMKSAGISPLPPVTGMDAEVSGVQRVLAGEQAISVYPNPKASAGFAGQVAGKLAQGQNVPSDGTTTSLSGEQVPLYQAPPPEVVTADTVQKVLIETGVYQASDICTPEYQAACAAHGVK